MTDVQEAVAVALWCQEARRASPNTAKGRTIEAFRAGTMHPDDRKRWLGLAQAAIATHTKALLDGAEPLCGLLEALAGDCDSTDGWEEAAPDLRQAAATIAAQAAEIATAREEGIRMGLDAALRAHRVARYDPAPYTKGKNAIEALDPAAIARAKED